jgi:UDP-3-O-[3-hydroxymyristoyl] N-acetylglucosamine deacetylase/3-hydroxyacyl-[acyl-carrier-protein] dehydratase
MSATNQRTLKKEVVIKGVGLHTGRKCRATIKPAAENAGITFVRTDLPGKPALRATLDNVVEVIRGTTLGIGDARVYTIEHILSALNGHEIDNALIELDDNEPPVCDGSAKEFVNAFAAVTAVRLFRRRNYFYWRRGRWICRRRTCQLRYRK